MKRSLLAFFIAATTFLAACSGDKQQNNESDNSTADTTAQEPAAQETPAAITLSKMANSPAYEDAMLEMNTPEAGNSLPSGQEIAFSYNVKNYELGMQTPQDSLPALANSGKGQHIHLILNNKPYFAHYEPEFKRTAEDGHYVALSFLSRSHHESVKNPNAFVVREFTVGNVEKPEVDLTAPHMFYSRPKGTYVGKDTENLLLDFYLVNTTLSASGNKVRATINGQEFMIDEWAPYIINGLPMGTVTIKLELLDAQGNAVAGPFNTVERTVTLKAEEAAAE